MDLPLLSMGGESMGGVTIEQSKSTFVTVPSLDELNANHQTLYDLSLMMEG